MIWLLPWGQENRVKHVSWAVYALIAVNVAVDRRIGLYFGDRRCLRHHVLRVSSATMDGAEGVNFVSHGIGFISGALFGVIARVRGVMQRYERLSEGGAWFGYWSDALGRRVRRAYPRK